MRLLVALTAWAMPVVAWLSNAGAFGPTNGAISDQYPTLLVAAGYAFAIWGLIFLLDMVYGAWQAFDRVPDERLRRIRPWTAAGFLLTAAWMIVFSLQWFWLALAIIWASLACLLFSTWQVSNTAHHGRSRWWQWVPLSLHAGWVSLAAFLNVAQVVVAFQLFSTEHMLPWTLVLYVLAAVLVLTMLVRLLGNPWYALAVLWALVGVFVKQQASALPGANTAAWIALGLAVAVVLITLWQRFGPRHLERRLAA
ncbi:MAG: hypothetical protein DYH20_00720 [Gammaproteobacteria bacterium PRO9]|nr:hypothetical protein [Gammaproteobacteria bacterium PRO9]